MVVCFDLANHPTKDTVKLLTCLLEKIATENDHHTAGSSSQDILSVSHSPYTCFHARSIPTITLQAYLVRILKYCPCANECLLALLVYFDRMAVDDSNQASLRINSYNIHRLVIAGIMVSSKFFSDVFYTNTRYAKVGGLPVAELNTLELEFLHLNHYSLFINVDELQQYGNKVLLNWNQVHASDNEELSNSQLDINAIIKSVKSISLEGEKLKGVDTGVALGLNKTNTLAENPFRQFSPTRQKAQDILFSAVVRRPHSLGNHPLTAHAASPDESYRTTPPPRSYSPFREPSPVLK